MQRPLPLRPNHSLLPHHSIEVQPGLSAWQSRSTYIILALLGGLLGVLGLLSGALVAIALVSISVAVGIYLHQIDRLYITWLPWRRWWRPANRPLTLALLGGAGALTTGITLQQMWQRSPWPGLMTLVLAQTLVMAIALWHRPAPRQAAPSAAPLSSDPPVEPILMALAAPHPIHQLAAIRRALQWAEASRDVTALQDIADCFQLMLNQRPDPVVQQALQRGLRQLNPQPLTAQPVATRNSSPKANAKTALTEATVIPHAVPVAAE